MDRHGYWHPRCAAIAMFIDATRFIASGCRCGAGGGSPPPKRFRGASAGDSSSSQGGIPLGPGPPLGSRSGAAMHVDEGAAGPPPAAPAAERVMFACTGTVTTVVPVEPADAGRGSASDDDERSDESGDEDQTEGTVNAARLTLRSMLDKTPHVKAVVVGGKVQAYAVEHWSMSTFKLTEASPVSSETAVEVVSTSPTAKEAQIIYVQVGPCSLGVCWCTQHIRLVR